MKAITSRVSFDLKEYIWRVVNILFKNSFIQNKSIYIDLRYKKQFKPYETKHFSKPFLGRQRIC